MTGYEEALRRRHRPAHATRTARSHAAFLLPYLRPGPALLDLGCGPGTMQTRAVAGFSAAGYADPAAVERAVHLGLATADEMAGFAGAWRAWGEHPGAFRARLWCEAIAFAD